MRSFPSPPPPPFLATTKGLAALWTLAMGASFGFLSCCLTGLGEISGMALRAFRVYAVAKRSRSNEIERFFLEIQFTLYFLFCIIKQ